MKSVFAATIVVIVTLIVLALFVQFKIITVLLAIPLFLIPPSLYLTAVGLTSESEKATVPAYTYYFTWSGVMLVVSLVWISLYEGLGAALSLVVALVVVLVYLFVNRAKSRSKRLPISPSSA